MNIKNLYIAYTFSRDLYKWKNDKEMIYDYSYYYKTPTTIEFLNKLSEYHILREYYKNGNIVYETSYKNGLRHGIAKSYYSNGDIHEEVSYINGKIYGRERFYG